MYSAASFRENIPSANFHTFSISVQLHVAGGGESDSVATAEAIYQDARAQADKYRKTLPPASFTSAITDIDFGVRIWVSISFHVIIIMWQ